MGGSGIVKFGVWVCIVGGGVVSAGKGLVLGGSRVVDVHR